MFGCTLLLLAYQWLKAAKRQAGWRRWREGGNPLTSRATKSVNVAELFSAPRDDSQRRARKENRKTDLDSLLAMWHAINGTIQ